jgi:hypothetical protein
VLVIGLGTLITAAWLWVLGDLALRFIYTII